MADEPKIDIQGEIFPQKQAGSPAYTGLITPYADPTGWYIETFPNYYALERYAMTYGLKIVKEEEK